MRIPVMAAIVLAILAPAWSGGAAVPDETERLARLQLTSFGCKACHRFEGAGSTNGPDLTRVGARLTAEQIAALLFTPGAEAHWPLLTPLEENRPLALVEFLATRR